MTKSRISKALLEVWEWKERACKEVEHLDIDRAVEVIIPILQSVTGLQKCAFLNFK